MGLLGGYAETAEELAEIEQRDRAYMEAEEWSEQVAALEAERNRAQQACEVMGRRIVLLSFTPHLEKSSTIVTLQRTAMGNTQMSAAPCFEHGAVKIPEVPDSSTVK